MLLAFAGTRQLQHLKICPLRDADQLTSGDSVLLILRELFDPAPGPMNRHRINLRVVTESEIETCTLLRSEPGTGRNESHVFPATGFHCHGGSDRVAIAFGPA